MTNPFAQVSSVSVGETRLANSPQEQLLAKAMSHSTNGTQNISAGSILMPPGKIARMHRHNKHEIIVVVFEGLAASLYGENLEPIVHRPGDFLHIPPGIPHCGINLSLEHRMIGIEMRTDPEFNEDVELLPELDPRAAHVAAELQSKYANDFPDYSFGDLL
ncbi:MAG: cupin domain-containing protein [Corynebacteriales bacterium]|nr:cupin domain-containing protein [Mycobacteriales bacterium]